ncbi:MAG: hypothetical protein ACRD1O_06475 [Terriglobia bacterium]
MEKFEFIGSGFAIITAYRFSAFGAHRGKIRFMDVEKTILFILEMQAKHDVTIQAILETQAKHDVTIQAILETQSKHEERFRTLVDVGLSLAASLERLGEETNRRFQETDYKLNTLIDVVDKLVKRNGSR